MIEQRARISESVYSAVKKMKAPLNRFSLIGMFFGLLYLTGCRGMESRREPIEPNPNMDFQERFDPQEDNPFFADRRSMRPPVPGTVPRGLLRQRAGFFTGKNGTAYVSEIPLLLDKAIIERGQDRYNIFCAVCHGVAGDSRGIIMVGTSTITGTGFGFTPAPSFHDPRLRAVEDGYIFEVLTNGIRTMPSYAAQIPVDDRWAIVAYFRALQRSQNASLNDVPAEERANLRQVPTGQAPAIQTPSTSDSTAAPGGSDTTSSAN